MGVQLFVRAPILPDNVPDVQKSPENVPLSECRPKPLRYPKTARQCTRLYDTYSSITEPSSGSTTPTRTPMLEIS